MTLLEKIDKLIAEQGLSRHKVEKEAGLSVSTLLKWDNSVPRADKLKAVADVLGTSLDYLLSDSDIEVKSAPQNVPYDFVITDGNESTLIDVRSDENHLKRMQQRADSYLESLITCYLLLSEPGKKCLAEMANNLKALEDRNNEMHEKLIEDIKNTKEDK